MSRPPGQRRPRQPRTPGKVLVELTVPQIRMLVDAGVAHDVVLEDRHEGDDRTTDRATAARDRATLDRALAALTPHLDHTREGTS